MKRTFVICNILVFIALNIYGQQKKEIKADIRHVTLYPDRAQVEHETQVTIATGKTILKLTGLSPYIDQQSVQVKGYGDFTILSVNQQNNYIQNLEDDPAIKELRSQTEALQAKIEDEKAAIGVLSEKASFLAANKALLVKETAVNVENIKAIMDLYTNNMEQVTLATLKKQRIIKEYEKQLAALQQELSAKLGREQLPSGEIEITVSGEKQVSGKLTISYVVSNAGWYPSYDIRVDDIKKPVSINFKANVFQRTGTAWNNVKLSFSNATPWLSGGIPEIYPWFVDYYYPQQKALRGKLSGVSMAYQAPAVRAEESLKTADEAPIAQGPVVEKKTGETTVVFDVAEPYSIPSDGKMQIVEIQHLQAPAEYKYMTIPKFTPLAYLAACVSDWEKLSLQSGEATLYFENSYVGKSYIDAGQISDTLALSLGTDNSILVKREKRKDLTSAKVLGSNKTELYSWLISVRNNKAIPIEITLKDQIPVSSNSGITVEAVELSGGKQNRDTGEINWDLQIKPGETKQIILTYSVKYPKDQKVILE
jgi:uncharacterized protein (TIGR02231 family)